MENQTYPTGTTLTGYVDGVAVASAEDTINYSQTGLVVGALRGADDLITGEWLTGWMDEIRVSIGIARWTANFTPPTGPYSKGDGAFLLRMI